MSMLLAAAGQDEKLYVDDVFSAYTYTGNGSTQPINNGIDLAGKGGLIWIKNRTGTNNNILFDTVRGANNFIYSNLTNASAFSTLYGQDFNFDGFDIGSSFAEVNASSNNYVSWTFRKAPKFFDIVTYTGDGISNRAISHALGTTVGMVITKSTSTTGDWNTYHRSATGDLVLNTTAAQTGSHAIVVSATDSTFTVTGVANTNGVTYVAYLFAHDTSTDGIIQCGSFTTDAGGNASVNLGWEPQFLLAKVTTMVNSWYMLDHSREFNVSGTTKYLAANASNSESTIGDVRPTATGFQSVGALNANQTYIYLAIRRPNKPPTTGTQVYNAIARTGTGAAATVTGVGFAPDLSIISKRGTASDRALQDRLRGSSVVLYTGASAADTPDSTQVTSYNMDGISVGSGTPTNTSGESIINWFFKRAVGVFDIVCYTGTGVATTVAHGLGVVPELMIVKKRSAADFWVVYHKDNGIANYMALNTIGSLSIDASFWSGTLPTASVFSLAGLSQVNQSSATFVAYLFATKAGISKCGNYVGNGSSQTIDCGFTTGARFVLIKRTDSTGDWYLWDTVRGIVAGNDPHLSLNTTAAEVTTDDSIDPDSTGFIVNQLAATNINVNAATYIYLAFA